MQKLGLLWRFGQVWGELLHEGESVLVLFLCLPHQVVQEGDPRLVGPRVHQLIQGVDAEPHGIASVTSLSKITWFNVNIPKAWYLFYVKAYVNLGSLGYLMDIKQKRGE